MTTVLDKEVLKEALWHLIREEPATIKSMLKEILAEDAPEKDAEFDRLLRKNFERFDETFRALA